jgi:hypothetical protein
MAEEKLNLNRDSACPSCGSRQYAVVGKPAAVYGTDGQPMPIPVRYSTVIECAECHNIRGK